MAAFGKHDRALPKRFCSSRSVKRWWHKGVSPAQQLVITVAAIALNVPHGKESIHTSLSLTPLRKAVSFAINFPKSSNSRPGQEKDVLQKGSKGPWITYILLWSFVECWHLKLKAWCPTSWRSITICKEQKSNTHSKSKSSKPLPKKNSHPCTIGKGQSLKVFYGIPWPLMKTHDPIPTMKAILDPTKSSKPLPKKNSHPCTIGKGQSLKVFYGIPWPLMKTHDPIPTMKAILDPAKSSKPLPKRTATHAPLGRANPWRSFMVFHDH